MTDSSDALLCPITHQLMLDPVIDPDGNSYERHAIEDWIRQSGTSPITRTTLSIDDLRPNRALKTAIDEYRHSIQPDLQPNHLPIELQSSELTISGSYGNGFLHISIQPPLNESRSPCDICCVVDTSGSMSDRAEIQNDKNEQYGLSQLDLVKHALKTIVSSLQAQDRLSIVSFSDSAKTLLTLTNMDDQGKTNALAALEKLHSNGSTNLWDGLQSGLEILSRNERPVQDRIQQCSKGGADKRNGNAVATRTRKNTKFRRNTRAAHSEVLPDCSPIGSTSDLVGSNSALFLLTDGCPNIDAPGGHLQALENLKKQINFTCAINTFGFGYNLNSKLLEDLSILGNSGSYAFIPDGSFVGTIFVNAISTLLTTMATNVQLLLHDQSLEPSDCTRWYSTSITDEGTYFNLGSITYGQSKDVLIPLPPDSISNCEFTLTCDTVQEKQQSLRFNVKDGLKQADLSLLLRHELRLEFVHCVRSAFETMRQVASKPSVTKKQSKIAMNQIKEFEKKMKKYANEDDEFIKDLFTDLTGQVQEAIGKEDWFRKWGIHFLPSLTRAHLLQYCNNFKDPGVQHYGQGTLFSTVRDEMDDIFCSLPAPKRSLTGATINMTAFHNAAGGCFYGECTVRLMDGTTKLVKDVKPGDRMAPHGGMVTYVIKTKCQNQKAKMVIVKNGLIITAWHPIRVDQQWIMPCSLVSSPDEISCDAVYNLALDQGHTVLVNNVECVTLGHGFKEDVVRHSYYGSQRVIEDLRRLDVEQNNSGLIEITEEKLVRSTQSGLVTGLKFQEILAQ